MNARDHWRTGTLGLLAGMALAACSPGSSDPVLTLEGTYTGSTSSSCQMALRAGDGSLVDSHTVESNFRQAFAVAPGKGRYFAQIVCPDGKSANVDGFDFDPPRETIKLGEIALN